MIMIGMVMNGMAFVNLFSGVNTIATKRFIGKEVSFAVGLVLSVMRFTRFASS